MRSITLNQLKPQQQARIASLELPPAEAQRLAEMGLIRGTPIWVRRTAAFGDPIEIEVRHTCMSLRKRTAEKIVVETEDES